MTARQRRSRAVEVHRQLSERELAVLASLARLRLLTTSQVRRLYVIGGPEASNTRRTQYLLKRLHQLKLVVRLSRVVGGRRAGSAGVVYGLSGFGLSVLLVPDLVNRPRRRVWDTRPYFQDHMLAVAELYVRLKEQERRTMVELLDFESEPACWRHFTGPGGDLVVVKPDAYVYVGLGELALSWFVEVDLGTETLPTIQRKCERYVAYWRAGIEQQRTRTDGPEYGVFPFVVWLAPDTRRKEKLAQAIRRMTAEAQTLFRVALLEDGADVLTRVPDSQRRDDDQATATSAVNRGPP